MVCITDLTDIIKDEMCLTTLSHVKLEMLTIPVQNPEENGLCTANTWQQTPSKYRARF
jgi:hypothetical protein